MSKAIVLLNMGGINSLDEVELFLNNMFSDKYILQTNLILRKIIGKMIVKKRVDEVKQNYKELGGKSPLLDITNKLCKKIKSLTKIPTYPIMRYTPPFATDILSKLKQEGIKEIIAISMYPHYSTTTTKSSIEDLKNALQKLNYSPELTIIDRYYNNLEYVKIQVNLIKDAIKNIDASKLDLIISAHGLPLSIIKKGDPYQKEIEANVNLIKKELKNLNINFKNIKLAYQSKVGNSAWLEPNLSDVLRNPSNLSVLIFPISFTIDNSETLFELNIEHKEIAQKIGYKFYEVVKCPNSSDEFAKFLTTLIP
jgi:ferrochelatase